MAKKKATAKAKAAKAAGDKARRLKKKEAVAAEAAAAEADAAADADADPPADATAKTKAAPPAGDAKPKRGLKALRKWNDERYLYWRTPSSRAPRLNGIACPDCGSELVDKNPEVMRPSNPPRFDVNCSAEDCHWHGARVG